MCCSASRDAPDEPQARRAARRGLSQETRAMIAMRLAAIGVLASAAAHLLSFTPWARWLGERTIWTLEAGGFPPSPLIYTPPRRPRRLRRRPGRGAAPDPRRPLTTRLPSLGSPGVRPALSHRL